MSSFLVFLLILFALAAFFRIDFFFTILYLFVGVYVVVRLWAEHMLDGLEARREFPRRAFIGDVVTVRLHLRNRSRLPIPWLLLNEAVHWSLASDSAVRRVVSLKGGEAHTLRYTLRPGRRGYYPVGPLVMNSGDLLGLRRSVTRRLEAEPLIVYPKIVPIAELGLPTHSP
ncbi:MAG: hypothetical protein D6796_00465, partial [Caldilineae bacterium]